MKKHIRLLLVMMSFMSFASFAQGQQISITGTVKDTNGESVIGANVSVEGTTIGTITDLDGAFNLEVPENGQLVVSYIGYVKQVISINKNRSFTITLKEDSEMLTEVVVTALGIKREKKALGYAMQEVKTDVFSENRSTSVSNLLQGKVAGVQISQSGSGVGGPTRVILRGLNSLSGNNAPLWVVDGLPILDNANGTLQFSYSSGAADLNPDDIESISVLKGANAAALYGSRAQNGAIVITTKKGKEGKVQFEYNGYVSASKAYDSYKLQDVYGQGTNGQYTMAAQGSWGPKMEGQMIPNWRKEYYGDQSYQDYAMLPQKNVIDDFFRTGMNYVNSVSATGGNENLNARFSFTDSRNEGILPNESMVKQNYNLNVELKNKYVTIGGKVAYFREKVKNRPMNFYGVWENMIQIPRNIRLQDLSNPIGKDGYIVNWAGDGKVRHNPYGFITDGNGNELNRDRLQGQLILSGNITDYLKLTGRIGLDRISDNLEVTEVHRNKAANPRDLITIDNSTREELNADLMLNFDKRFNDFSISANLGIATYYNKYKGLAAESGEAIIPDFIALSNGLTKLATQGFNSKRINSILGNATVGYKGYAYLDVTARNDWSSTLPSSNWSYFYPSASLSGILSDIFKMPKEYFLKVRGSIAQVGNDTSPYALYNVYTLSTIGNLTVGQTSTTYPLADLKPEKTTSWELGFDYRMFNNRLGFDFTYYKSTTTNQILSMSVPASSGYTNKRINAGKMESKGIELMVNGTPIMTKDWRWDVTLNWGKNTTRNVELDEKIKRYTFPLTNNVKIGKVVIDEGGRFGDIVSTAYQRNDDGRILVDDSGLPLINTKSEQVIGNMTPDWTGSFSTTLAYKNIVFSALVDVRYGGEFLSLTDALASGAGNSARTLEGREGMVVDGIVKSTGQENAKEVSAQQYYAVIAGSYPVGEEFLHDATYVKLREISIGYTLPATWLRKTPISNVKVSVVGRDLFNIYKAAPVNAEFAQNSQDVFQAFELASFPSTRTVGFSLNVKF
ncbi:SusC/RagA family TonB-linked outer membrane protein [Bacteroides sp. 51]|uniref:SusC/RagA family TonB-linked outer membrane protein n=1 Tax=Bacteroides sp. 51 TaxID=2302938 RepID=UPI00194023A6|nr:SusC/RagA family TonB-linked outer membrane protein [Bacteroides sp. 51]